jgi:outer membrane lipoprotein-sorting protein
MNVKKMVRLTLVLFWMVGAGCVSGAADNTVTQKEKKATDPVDKVLEQLNKSTRELKSYQGQIEFKFTQPSLFDSQDLRKGTFYYLKDGNKSRLRVNFQTRKQDDEREHKYKEQFIALDGDSLTYPGHRFEGTWLACIDYQIPELKLIQLAEPGDPNKPVDVFEMASKHLPLVGFTKIEELKEQFEVSLIEQKTPESKDFIQVHLKVRPNSIYKDDYIYIDFWIDRKLNLPAKVVAVTTEEDIYEIKFLQPKVNKAINKKVFDFKIPKKFGEPEIIPLKGKNEQ